MILNKIISFLEKKKNYMRGAGRAVMNRDKFDKILTTFSHAQKKLPACILQCKDCLSDRCELPFHEPTFHDPIDTAWSYTSSSNVTIVDNPYLNQRTTSSNGSAPLHMLVIPASD